MVQAMRLIATSVSDRNQEWLQLSSFLKDRVNVNK